jgi:hypothetical protein
MRLAVGLVLEALFMLGVLLALVAAAAKDPGQDRSASRRDRPW